jgi:glucose-1-phosphate thymidylyltransferase
MSNFKKGIILAGGSGTRLHPITYGISKHLIPIYDKPMIFYPLSVLMLASIKEILIISTPDDIYSYERLLGDGTEYGISITYAIQNSPGGLPEAFIIGKDFIKNENVALALGDNIFYGQHFTDKLESACSRNCGATIFSYHVPDPERFGVAEFDDAGKVISIEEKPAKPKSSYAVTGLYFYDNNVIKYAHDLKPSSRGELEITDINKKYLENNMLNTEILGRGFAWLDTGTHDSLVDASQFIQTIEQRQGLKVACLEEISYQKGWMSKDQLIQKGKKILKTEYGQYLLKIAKGYK